MEISVMKSGLHTNFNRKCANCPVAQPISEEGAGERPVPLVAGTGQALAYASITPRAAVLLWLGFPQNKGTRWSQEAGQGMQKGVCNNPNREVPTLSALFHSGKASLNLNP